MKKYDVIIVGAGIAGCGLAYNLKRAGYKGSVLVIDKKGIGSNRGHGYRATFSDIMGEYGLPYELKSEVMALGMGAKVYASLREKVYYLDYKKICKKLLCESGVSFKREKAQGVKGNVLVTNKGRNEFRYLIDCSGISYFLRDQFNLPKPFRYWSANIIIMRNNKYPKDFCYHSFDDEGGFEEICVISDKVIYARWFYSDKLDKKRFKQSKNSFYDTCLKDQKVISRSYCTYPVSFVLPLVYRNYAFLGDSFGNAPPLSGFGLKAILNSSKLLAGAIMKGNLSLFEKDWRKEYFSLYLKQLASKVERSNNRGILAKIKNYPNYRDLMEFMLKKHSGFLLKAFKDEPNLEIPRDMRNLFPKRQLLFTAATYLMLRIRYLFHDLRRFLG